MDKTGTMNRCDSCGQFGETEDVVVTIKKHKSCDINGAFRVKEPVTISHQVTPVPPAPTPPTEVTRDSVMHKMGFTPQPDVNGVVGVI